MKLETVVSVVTKINIEIEDSYTGSQVHLLYLTSDGYEHTIEFCGDRLWNSENDVLEYDEHTDQFKLLYNYIKEQYKYFIINMNKQKIKMR